MVNRLKNRGDRSERKRGFVYTPRSAKAIKARAEQTGQMFDSMYKPGIDVWKPKQGDNNIRILPPTWDDPEHYGFEAWIHYSVGSDQSAYLCRKKMKKGNCPICDAAAEAKAAGEDDEAKELQPRNSFMCWIIDRDDKPTPMLYSMSWTMDRDIAALCHDKKSGKVLLIDDPEKGYDVSFKRKGTTKNNTKYFGIAIDRSSSPIEESEKKQDKIIDFITENPIPDVLKFFDEDYLEQVVSGKVSKKDTDLDDDDDDDDDDRGRRRKRSRDDDDDEEDDRKSKKRSSRDDDDEDEDEKPRKRRGRDEDEDEEDDRKSRRRSRDDDEEDDEDEKPSRRRSSRDDDDEEEEDTKPSKRRSRDDDEDEEDEKPRRRSSRDDDDDEDEDEKPRKRASRDDDEEDEDEDERPRKRRR